MDHVVSGEVRELLIPKKCCMRRKGQRVVGLSAIGLHERTAVMLMEEKGQILTQA